MFVAFVVDAVVWIEAPGIKFHDDDEEESRQPEIREEKTRLHDPDNSLEILGNQVNKSKSESSL